MEKNLFSARDLMRLFRQELGHLYPSGETDQIFYLLAEFLMGWTKIMAHTRMEETLSPEVIQKFLSALKELTSGRPVQYIIGIVDFSGAKIKVNEDVLIPRPETEELTEFIASDQVQNRYNDFSLLDIGTGSGCIPVALAKRFSGLTASALDISERALNVARENASSNGVSIQLLRMNILDKSRWNELPFYDIIVSNPPYVPEKERKTIRKNVLFEPGGALFVPDDDPLIFYKAITEFAALHLNRPGYLYFEIHEEYGPQIRKIMSDAGFEKVVIKRDFRDKDRFALGEARFAMKDQSYWHVEH